MRTNRLVQLKHQNPHGRLQTHMHSAGAVSEQAAAAAITRLLDQLQSSGYICGWQVVWGEQPGAGFHMVS